MFFFSWRKITSCKKRFRHDLIFLADQNISNIKLRLNIPEFNTNIACTYRMSSSWCDLGWVFCFIIMGLQNSVRLCIIKG